MEEHEDGFDWPPSLTKIIFLFIGNNGGQVSLRFMSRKQLSYDFFEVHNLFQYYERGTYIE